MNIAAQFMPAVNSFNTEENAVHTVPLLDLNAPSTSADSTAAAAATGPTYSGAISDDVLLEYCKSRLNGIDSQIDSQFNDQKNIQDATNEVGSAQSAFSSSVNGLTKSETTDTVKQLTDAMSKLPAGDPQRDALQSQITSLNTSLTNNAKAADTDVIINPADCKKFADSLGDINKDLNSDAELQMMTLQSLISQRQTAVQMCTGMMSSLDDTQKSVAEKIGS